MIDAAVRAAFASEGPATFATMGPDGPHLVATWQSYLEPLDETTLAFPAGGFRVTEANLKGGSHVWMVVGTRGVTATGFRLEGTAELQAGNALHERFRGRFPWCRAVVVFHVAKVERILGS